MGEGRDGQVGGGGGGDRQKGVSSRVDKRGVEKGQIMGRDGREKKKKRKKK